jgi:hypothetical protein
MRQLMCQLGLPIEDHDIMMMRKLLVADLIRKYVSGRPIGCVQLSQLSFFSSPGAHAEAHPSGDFFYLRHSDLCGADTMDRRYMGKLGCGF